MPFSAIFLLFEAVGGIAALGLLLGGVIRFPSLGSYLAYAVVLLQFDYPALPPLVRPAGISLFLPDVICLILFASALLRLREVPLGVIRPAFGLVALLLLFAVFAGISKYGVQESTNEARILLLPFIGILWAFTIDWSARSVTRIVYRPLRVAGWLLVLIAGYHAARYGVGGATSRFIDIGGVLESSRVLTQIQAFVLALSAITSLWLWAQTRLRRDLAAAIVFAAVIVLSQQRTVWVSSLAAVVVLYLAGSTQMRNRILQVAAFGLAFVLSVLLTSPGRRLASSIRSSFDNRTTYEARTSGWQALVSQQVGYGHRVVLLGRAFGAGFSRVDSSGTLVTFSPHNFYVLVFLRIGLVGFSAYIVLFLWPLIKLIRVRDSPLAMAMWVSVAVFCWSYGISWVFAPIIGFIYREAASSDVARIASLRAVRPTPLADARSLS